MNPAFLDLSLEDLEASDWGLASRGDTGLIRRCLRLRRVPLAQLTASDLRVLICQDIGREWLVPRAIELLKPNPLLESEYYPGDLLISLLEIGPKFWSQNTELHGSVAALAAPILAAPEVWTSPIDPAEVGAVRHAFGPFASALATSQESPEQADREQGGYDSGNGQGDLPRGRLS